MSSQYPFRASTEALIQKQITERNSSTRSLPAPTISDIMGVVLAGLLVVVACVVIFGSLAGTIINAPTGPSPMSKEVRHGRQHDPVPPRSKPLPGKGCAVRSPSGRETCHAHPER